RISRQYISPRRVLFVTGEGILIFSAVSLASYFLLERGLDFFTTLQIIWPKVILVSFLTQLSLYFNDLYEFKSTDTAMDIASRLIQAIGITSIALALVYFIWPEMIIGRWIFFVSLVILLFFLVSWRIIYSIVIRRKIFTEKAILIGDGDLTNNILQEIQERRDLSYSINGIVAPEKSRGRFDNKKGIPVYHGFDTICDLAEAEDVGNVIVALDEKRGIMPYNELLRCKMRGINIIDGESFYERISGKLLVEKINPSWLIFSDGFVKSRFIRVSKRVIDLAASTVLLVLSLPVILIAALAIKLDSPGGVFFSQERVGEFGRIFVLYKFRSMKSDAEQQTGPVWATEDDSRITRVGKIVRNLRIDELPQLWNVFKGDMSFVGPRPERSYFVEQLKKKIPYYNERFGVKPGITGWAQVKYPYGASDEDALEKLKYELYYIKNMSPLLDLIVIFHTAKIVLLGRGSR
ncbi:MAG: TIGR03013 family XrtA/PEP-CTERM system glycosyltransferase, partial [Desulfatiglandaceae bacterium]